MHADACLGTNSPFRPYVRHTHSCAASPQGDCAAILGRTCCHGLISLCQIRHTCPARRSRLVPPVLISFFTNGLATTQSSLAGGQTSQSLTVSKGSSLQSGTDLLLSTNGLHNLSSIHTYSLDQPSRPVGRCLN